MTRQRGPTLGYGKILRAVGASTWFKLTPAGPENFSMTLGGILGLRRQAAGARPPERTPLGVMENWRPAPRRL